MSTDGTQGGEANKAEKLADLVKANPGLQEELNVMMAENRRNLTKQNSELVAQLEQIKNSAKLTAEEKETLQSRINQLEEQFMTKEELSKRELAKAQKQAQQLTETLTSERDGWKNMYASATIERSLQDAAISGEAVQPSQIVEMLRGRTQLSEVIEDGKATGRYTPVVKFNDVNENGQPVVLELSPSDAIKRMKELTDRYGNLFKGTATGGLGENVAGGKGQQISLEILKDPVKYAEWRKKNPDLDLSKIRR